LRLIILGSCGGYPEPGRACSGYLVESGKTKIWVDAGTGTLGSLLRFCPLDDLDAIMLTHLHPDHWTDLPIALHQYSVQSQGQPSHLLPVYGPPGWPEATGVSSQWYSQRGARPYEVNALAPGEQVSIGELTVTTAAVEHSVPTFALRISDGKRNLVYSADTRACDSLRDIVTGADLFLCEATLPPGQETSISMNPAQAGRLATEAGVRHLVLTHLLPGIDPAESCAIASKHFAGPVDHADQGRTFDV
jgi:ribonuclease BN (tRNA processing enzyme)